MGKLVGRHGFSAANDRNNFGTPAFGSTEAHLMPDGIRQAHGLSRELVTKYNIHPEHSHVAVSTLTRTRETALAAGFVTITAYDLLDEVKHDLDVEAFMALKQTGNLPARVLNEAERTLNNPPEEEIWICHGLRIAAMCRVLDVHQDSRLFPRFCELRYLPIGD